MTDVPTVQGIANHCKVEIAWLEREVPSNCFYDISCCLSAWELLAAKLNFSQADIDDIKEENLRKMENQRLGFVRKWKQKMSMKATYRALMEALLGIDRAGDAQKVCKVLKATLQPAAREEKPCTPPAEDDKHQNHIIFTINKSLPTSPDLLHKDLLHKVLDSYYLFDQPAKRDLSLAKGESFCKEHGSNKVALYCETCDKLICTGCALRWGNHHDHIYEHLNKAAEKCRLEMTTSLELVEKHLTRNKEALARLEGRCEELADQKTAIEADLHQAFKNFHEILNTRKRELTDQLHQSTKEKLEKLAKLRNQLETTQVRLSSCLTNMKKSLETESHEEVLTKKTMVAEQVQELTSMPPPNQLKPLTPVTFSHCHNLSAYCQKYMQILELGLPESSEEEGGLGDHSKKRPAEPHISKLELGIDAQRTGHTDMRRGVPQGEEIREVELASQRTGPIPWGQVRRREMLEIGTPISTPWDVAINHRRGEVLVTEYGAEQVSVFSLQGKRLRAFSKLGSSKGQVQFFSAVEVDGEGNILVADCYNHCIKHFTPEGNFIREAGNYNRGPLQLNYPSGIVFNKRNNKIYVTDSWNVLVLNSDLTLVTTFSKRGSGEGYRPCGIACDSSGNIYVPDSEGHRIQVFTAAGEFIKTFGQFGGEQGQLNFPSHVAFDSQDNVYVSEKHRVSVFTPTHAFITSYSTPGNRPLCPQGMAVDSNKVVYVCDWVNNRVQILQYCSTSKNSQLHDNYSVKL